MRGASLILLTAASSIATPLDDLTQFAEAAATGPVDQLGANRAALLAAIPDTMLDDAGHPMPLDWLRDAAAHGDRPTLVRAWERLKAAQDAHGHAPHIDAERVRTETAAILAQDDYQPLRAASWIDPWLPYIERFFDLLFAPFSKRGGETSAAATWFGVLLYTALSLTMAALLAKRLRRPRRRPTAPATGPAAAWPAPDADAWWSIAERALAEQRPTVACAAAWRGLLQRLDETGWLPYDPSKTPRESAAAVAAMPVGAPVAAAAEQVEGWLFGGRPATPDEVRALIQVGQQVGSRR